MSQKIKKKFLSDEIINYFDNQIDAVELRTTSNESDLNSLESEIDQEKLDRASGDSALQLQIDSLNGTFATDSELALAVSSLQSSIASEASLRQSEDLLLDGKINIEKGRIDAILTGASADLDSFAEVVALVNLIDTTNDQAFAGYALQNDAKVSALESGLSSEISSRQSADAQGLVDAKAYTDLKISQIPPTDLSNYYNKSEVDAKDALISSDLSSLDVYAQDLRSDHDGLEVYAQDIRSDLDSLQSAFDAQVDGPSFNKMKVVISSELAFIDLAHSAIENSVVVCVGRLMAHKDEDFSLSVVGGVSRLTWIGSMANPSGDEKIEAGDSIFVTYAY
jgi:hypothetical protein